MLDSILIFSPYQEWQEDGGIMILGYDMFRNLASGSNVRQKKLRETFEKCLINPGQPLAELRESVFAIYVNLN